jgi:GH24 family phage-related lysozyme (muramidase)
MAGDATTPQQEADFEALMKLREGCRNDVYLDTVGKATVGIGHLVQAGDNLNVGDVITGAQVDAFFAQDGAKAMNAAQAQAAEAGITDPTFVPYLASVNFQLGTDWTAKFPNTWNMIVNGQYDAAADALNGTVWNTQTPTRVQDFQGALRRLPPKP